MLNLSRIALLSSATMLCAAAPAFAQTKPFEVPSQSVAKAISVLGHQADIQIVGASRLTHGKTSQAIKGTMTVEEALQRLLAGTGLAAQRIGASSFTIVMAGPVGNAVAAPVAAPVDPQQNDEGAALAAGDIVVTAEKRQARLIDTPVAVSAIPSTQLIKYGQTNLLDYAALIPGLQVDSSTGYPGAVNITIRGMTTGSTTIATAATYVDNVPTSSSSSFVFGGFFGTDLLPYDVAQIEVLKGPQGTLYGANSLAGLLKYVTPEPDLHSTTFKMATDVRSVDNGNQLGLGGRVAGNIPLIADILAINFSAAHQVDPGYIDNIQTGVRAYNRSLRDGLRLSVEWLPAEKLKLQLTGLFDQIHARGEGGIVIIRTTGVPTYGFETTAYPVPIGTFSRRLLVYADIAYDFGAFKALSTTSLSRSYNDFIRDSSASFQPIYGIWTPFYDTANLRKWTQELRLQAKLSALADGQVGAFYTQENGLNGAIGRAIVPGTTTANPKYDPFLVSNNTSSYREAAAFANLTLHPTSRLNLSGGLRYSWSRQIVSAYTNGYLVGFTLLPTTYNPASSHVVNFSAGADYHLTPDAMIYTRVATGYIPGGPNVAAPIGPTSFGPSKSTNYEVGIKMQTRDKKLFVDASIYQIDWKGVQISVTRGGFAFIDNASSARSKGFEFSGGFRPIEGLTATGTVTYTDAKLTADAPSLGALSGSRLPLSAKWSETVGLDYMTKLTDKVGFEAGLIWRFIGDRNGAFNPGPAALLPSYNRGDIHAGIDYGHWSASLFVKNITNSHGFLSNPGGGAYPVIIVPRTIGGTVEFRL